MWRLCIRCRISCLELALGGLWLTPHAVICPFDAIRLQNMDLQKRGLGISFPWTSTSPKTSDSEAVGLKRPHIRGFGNPKTSLWEKVWMLRGLVPGFRLYPGAQGSCSRSNRPRQSWPPLGESFEFRPWGSCQQPRRQVVPRFKPQVVVRMQFEYTLFVHTRHILYISIYIYICIILQIYTHVYVYEPWFLFRAATIYIYIYICICIYIYNII